MANYCWFKLALFVGCLTAVLNLQATVDCQRFVALVPEKNNIQYLNPNISLEADESAEVLPDGSPKLKKVPINVRFEKVETKTEVSPLNGSTKVVLKDETTLTSTTTTTSMPVQNVTTPRSSASKVSISYWIVISTIVTIVYLS